MQDRYYYDYIIIGSGLAGLQLALKMVSDIFFKDKRIAIIDPSKKNINDKTWSFWETTPSQWHDITYKTWQHAAIFTTDKSILLNLTPHRYKTVRAIDFYNYAKAKLQKHGNVSLIIDTVIATSERDMALVQTELHSYKASHVFDSRLPEPYYKTSKNYTTLIQHFKGYIIKTETDIFDDTTFTMMDYRLKDGAQTTFTYVLPFSKNEALVEFTYFTAQIVDDNTYDNYIKTYIKTYLGIDTYEILETEKGQIPMTNFPFKKYNTKHITKIGTGGGWVKGSTGYSFKHTEKKVAKIIGNIKHNKRPSSNLFKRRYLFYDSVFLNVLKHENNKGEQIFQQFYSKNSTKTILKFLDEDSSLIDDLKVMMSLLSWRFVKAFFRTL